MVDYLVLLVVGKPGVDGKAEDPLVDLIAAWQSTSWHEDILADRMMMNGHVMHLNADSGVSQSVEHPTAILDQDRE